MVTPLLSKSDQGHFQCFLNDEWRGSVFIYVETIFVIFFLYKKGIKIYKKKQIINMCKFKYKIKKRNIYLHINFIGSSY